MLAVFFKLYDFHDVFHAEVCVIEHIALKS